MVREHHIKQLLDHFSPRDYFPRLSHEMDGPAI